VRRDQTVRKDSHAPVTLEPESAGTYGLGHQLVHSERRPSGLAFLAATSPPRGVVEVTQKLGYEVLFLRKRPAGRLVLPLKLDEELTIKAGPRARMREAIRTYIGANAAVDDRATLARIRGVRDA